MFLKLLQRNKIIFLCTRNTVRLYSVPLRVKAASFNIVWEAADRNTLSSQGREWTSWQSAWLESDKSQIESR